MYIAICMYVYSCISQSEYNKLTNIVEYCKKAWQGLLRGICDPLPVGSGDPEHASKGVAASRDAALWGCERALRISKGFCKKFWVSLACDSRCICVFLYRAHSI